MKLRNKINREITKASVIVLIICLCLFIPWQAHKSKVINKKLIALIQNFIAKDNVSLANAIFENRKRSIRLRVEELIKIDGIRGAEVFDHSGQVLSSKKGGYPFESGRLHFEQAKKEGFSTWTERDTLWYLQAIKAVDEIKGFILIEYSLADMKEKDKMSLLFYTLIFVSLILIMLFLTNRLIRKIILVPVDRLILSMSHIENGRYGAQVEPISEDEIGELAKRFNAMSSEIDISYKQIEKQNRQLQKAKNLLDGIINSMPSVLITIGNQCKIKQWNAKATEVSGFDASKAFGKDLSEIFGFVVPLMPQLKKALSGRKYRKFSKVETTEKNLPRYFDLIVYPIASDSEEDAVIIIDDVTTLVHMEAMMVQNEKMMSIGGLAAGMAHEINNPLAGMIQTAQVISSRMTLDLPANVKAAEMLGISMDVIRKYAEKRKIETLLGAMQTAGDRAAKIVKNMLTFSRQSTAQFFTCRLDKLLDDTIILSENDYDLKKKFDFREIEIHREYDPQAPMVDCDGNGIQQVFFNIIKNGTESIADDTSEKEKHKLWLRIKKVSGFVQVEIEDNGPGMTEEVQKRIFEPFFTTKEVGVGMGLGLSVSYFIITENHNGKMWVESSHGVGTKFIIQIPVTHFFPQLAPDLL